MKKKLIFIFGLVFIWGSAVFAKEIKIIASDSKMGEEKFGESVAISGDYVIVGVPYGDQGRGSAYIFHRNDTTWYEQTKLFDIDGFNSDHFGISVAIDGEYAIIGAYGGKGSAYIYKRNGISWERQAQIQPTDRDTINNFGISVSISGDYVIVGSRYDATKTGSAYIFKRSLSTWNQQAKLTTKRASEDNYGYSVSISGDYAIVGDHGDIDNGWAAGAVYVYHRNDTTWHEETKILADDGGYNKQFGYAVSISGDYAIISGYSANANKVYIFKRNGISWNVQAKLLPIDPDNPNYFGSSVSICGNYAIVGAPSNSGYIVAFLRTGNKWVQTDIQMSSDGEGWDRFGTSVSISGDYAIVGAPFHSTKWLQDGAAYIYHAKEDLLLFSFGDTIPPNPPQNLRTISGINKVTLNWSENYEKDLSYYKIYRSQLQNFVPIKNDSIGINYHPSTTFVDSNVIIGKIYYYRISAVDSSGNESDFSDEVSATPRDNIPPAKPKNLQATAGDKKVILSWSPNPEPDLSCYKIYRNQSQNVIPIDFDSLAIVFKPDSSCVDHDVTNGLTYYYVISAVDASGNESDFSEMVNATPQAGAGSADIALSANHHDFGAVPVFSTSSWQLVIENNGSANLVINHIESNNPVFTVAARQFSIVPQNKYQLEIQFQPDSLQSEQGILTIKSNDPDQPEIDVTLTGNGIDNQAPGISLQTPAQAMWINSDFQVSAQIIDNWAIGSAMLHYRSGLDMNFQGTAMSQGANHSFSGIIPASAMTFAGLAYFIKAEDSSGNTTFSDTLSNPIYFLDNALRTSRLQCPYQPGYPRGEWFMVSVPAILEQASVSAVLMDETELGNYGEPNWRLFSYQDADGDNVTDSYMEFRSDLESSVFRFDSGRAFWLKANPAGNQIEIDVGAGHILPLQPKTIQLNPGWNQVGNPFAFPIAFSPSSEQVVDQLYLPDGSGGYQLTTTMQPWAGYFVFVNGNENVNIALAPKSGSLLEKPFENESDWKIQVCASCGASKDEINYLGINELSRDEWDGKDYPEPPGIGDYISLYFPHRNWSPTCENYTTDFRSEIGDGQVWDFNVWTNIKSDITLTWHIIKNLDTDLQISLYDRNRNEIINMKEHDEYIFSRMNQESLSQFQIFVGNKNFVDRQIEEKRSQLPEQFGLSQNYPNPFNSGTSIQIQVAAPQQVSLKIIDLLGREVRTLVDEYRPAGYFQVSWDGKDNRGMEVVTGLYLCIFQAGQYFESRKVLVLK